MKNKWRMPHPATMFLLLTMAVVFLSWICDIYGLNYIDMSEKGSYAILL